MTKFINSSFKGLGFGLFKWKILEEGIKYRGKVYLYKNMDKPLHVHNSGNAFTSGTLLASLDGKQTRLTFQGFRYREVYDFVDWANKIIESNNH